MADMSTFLRICGALAALAMLITHPASAEDARFRGGAGGRTIEVTTLADGGPGSLRAALAETGARTIVFRVAGEIWLRETLLIREPFVTVAGETAPSPGITLMGDRLRLRSHDVVLRHLRVRVGALPTGFDAQNRDGMTIDGSADGRSPAYNILVENCSISWAIDEGLQLWGPNSHDITVRRSIIAEGLHRSIHPKGAHSMGLIVGGGLRNIRLEENLFAHNAFRNPAVAGAEVAIVNNLIYNPLHNAIHFYPDRQRLPTRAVIVGNVVVAGPDTRPRLVTFGHGLNPGSEFHMLDNRAIGTQAFMPEERAGRKGEEPVTRVAVPPLPLPATPLPSAAVEAHVLAQAGARPADRDATDRRIIAEVRDRKGRVRDEPPDARLAAPPRAGRPE